MAPEITQVVGDAGAYVVDYMKYQSDAVRFARVEHELAAIKGFTQFHALVRSIMEHHRAAGGGGWAGGTGGYVRPDPFAVGANPYAGQWGNPAGGLDGTTLAPRNPFTATPHPLPTTATPEEQFEHQRRMEQTRTIHMATHSASHFLQNLALTAQTYQAFPAFRCR